MARPVVRPWQPALSLKDMLHVVLAALLFAVAGDYERQITEWRRNYEAKLKTPTGYLAIAGLWWLKTGEQVAGSDPTLAIVLPQRAPKQFGKFLFSGGKVTFTQAGGSPRVLRTDKATEGPEILRIDDMELFVIQRNERFGLRLRDPQSATRAQFQGTRWYAPLPEWKIEARFLPYPQPKIVLVNDVTGNKQKVEAPGVVEFMIAGRTCRLEPTIDEGELFFVFKDKSAGHGTYGAGRFLKSAMPSNGKVELDFNKAYNPPCAFTPYATCPLPLKKNFLDVAIPAGEQVPPGH